MAAAWEVPHRGGRTAKQTGLLVAEVVQHSGLFPTGPVLSILLPSHYVKSALIS